MFENVDGRTDRRRTTDDGVTGILIAHLGAFGSGELKMTPRLGVIYRHVIKSIIMTVGRTQPYILPLYKSHIKVRKRAKIRNRYNQVPHLTQDTNSGFDRSFMPCLGFFLFQG